MFDSQNPMTALGMMYALRLTQNQPRHRRGQTRSVSLFTRVSKSIAGLFASRRPAPQPTTVVKLPTPLKPDLPRKRAA